MAAVFNYLPDGSPTFHMGSADYEGITARFALNRFAGGRSFGGPLTSGSLVDSAGEISFRFSKNQEPYGFDTERLLAMVKIPGEPAKRMVRMSLETAALSPQGLLGQWWMTFLTDSNGRRESKLVNLTTIDGETVVSDDGLVRCNRLAGEYPWDMHSHINCSWVRGTEKWTARFFQESNNRSYDALQMKDRHGNSMGLGSLPLK
ncbi:hypothetical protein [Diaphorobacter aerolatus]|uniref:Uncharacterized protein n=1 Tax=Diaphorobacter aerolatus TaxID=1288495 RepID=A0A7H0GG26_9BURK|nr:hypothetical protein [Diaphorobacter aerolatus]QNP47242.1 hypothetical protein H9K75_12710 [Diaphorobacter aerolatus]